MIYKISVKVISPLGEFQGNEETGKFSEKKIEEFKSQISKSHIADYFILQAGSKTIFFPAQVIQKSIVIANIEKMEE